MDAPAAAKRPYWQAPTAAAAAAEPNKRHCTAVAAAAPAPMDAKPKLDQDQPLLPGLPDHLAQLCLAPLPPRLLHAVCRPWRRLLYSPSFPPFLSLYAVLDDASASGSGSSSTGDVSFAAYDAVAGRWDDVPAPPSSPPRLWHPSFLSRRLPLQSVAAGGRLVLVAGSTRSLAPALPRPVVFDPAARAWRLGPRFPFAPRRWCAAGAARGRVFVAGGVGAGYDASDARSGATWDPSASSAAAGSGWERIPPMRDARFSRDAAEAVCAAGKVCMVSLRGRGAKEGAVFDLRAARWEDMPPGMLAGWKGPAAAADDETTVFVVDEERGALRAARVRLGRGPVAHRGGVGEAQGRRRDGGGRGPGVRGGARRREGGRGRRRAQQASTAAVLTGSCPGSFTVHMDGVPLPSTTHVDVAASLPPTSGGQPWQPRRRGVVSWGVSSTRPLATDAAAVARTVPRRLLLLLLAANKNSGVIITCHQEY